MYIAVKSTAIVSSVNRIWLNQPPGSPGRPSLNYLPTRKLVRLGRDGPYVALCEINVLAAAAPRRRIRTPELTASEDCPSSVIRTERTRSLVNR